MISFSITLEQPSEQPLTVIAREGAESAGGVIIINKTGSTDLVYIVTLGTEPAHDNGMLATITSHIIKHNYATLYLKLAFEW